MPEFEKEYCGKSYEAAIWMALEKRQQGFRVKIKRELVEHSCGADCCGYYTDYTLLYRCRKN